jgi:hypothetical protein
LNERSTILHEAGQAFRDNGLTAAITALMLTRGETYRGPVLIGA